MYKILSLSVTLYGLRGSKKLICHYMTHWMNKKVFQHVYEIFRLLVVNVFKTYRHWIQKKLVGLEILNVWYLKTTQQILFKLLIII